MITFIVIIGFIGNVLSGGIIRMGSRGFRK